MMNYFGYLDGEYVKAVDDCIGVMQAEKKDLTTSAERLRRLGSPDLYHDRMTSIKTIDKIIEAVKCLK